MPEASGEQFPSARLRERDKHTNEKHEIQIEGYKRALNNAKKEKGEVWTRYLDLSNATERVVTALGFSNIAAVQECIDAAEGSVQYRDCLKRNTELEKDNDDLIQLNEDLSARLQKLEEENGRLTEEHEHLKRYVGYLICYPRFHW
jgi:hypothetical protein